MKIDDNFKWFTGVVEDRNDPDKLNRVRVRVFGSHTDNKKDLATADLPWAAVMMPTTSSSNSGIGLTVHGLVEGSWVIGFWKDGNSQQDPMIMGSFAGIEGPYIKQKSEIMWGRSDPTSKFLSNTTDASGAATIKEVLWTDEAMKDWYVMNPNDWDGPKTPTGERAKVGDVKIAGITPEGIQTRPYVGFLDPRLEKLSGYEKTPEGLNPDHNPTRGYGLTLDLYNSPRAGGSGGWGGVNYPKDAYMNESDVNKLARGDGTYNKDIWPNNKIKGYGKKGYLFSGKGTSGDNEDRESWVKPKYPFNHVYESESGHVIEIDDTPGYERINLFHRSGARIEINDAGEIHMVASKGQDLNLQGANVNIQGDGSGTVSINAECAVNIIAKEAASITASEKVTVVSKGPTSIISSGVTKLFSMLETKIAGIGKIKIG